MSEPLYHREPLCVKAWQRPHNWAEGTHSIPLWVARNMNVSSDGRGGFSLSIRGAAGSMKGCEGDRTSLDRTGDMEHGDWLVEDIDGTLLMTNSQFKVRYKVGAPVGIDSP